MLGCKHVAKVSKKEGSCDVDEALFRSLARSLLNLTTTRHDIIYAASLLSRFNYNSTHVYGAAKRILRYIQGTSDFEIVYERVLNQSYWGFVIVIWMTRKSRICPGKRERNRQTYKTARKF